MKFFCLINQLLFSQPSFSFSLVGKSIIVWLYKKKIGIVLQYPFKKFVHILDEWSPRRERIPLNRHYKSEPFSCLKDQNLPKLSLQFCRTTLALTIWDKGFSLNVEEQFNLWLFPILYSQGNSVNWSVIFLFINKKWIEVSFRCYDFILYWTGGPNLFGMI